MPGISVPGVVAPVGAPSVPRRRSGPSFGVRVARTTQGIDGPQDRLDRAQDVALGMGQRIQSKAPQRRAQPLCIRLAHFEIMYEVACAFAELGMHAGEVVRILCFERNGTIMYVLEQIPDLSDVGVFVHDRQIIRGEH